MPIGQTFMMWLAAQMACMVASATISDLRDCAEWADTCNSPSGRHSLVSQVELHDEISLLQIRSSTDDAQQEGAEDADAYDELEDPKIKKAEDAKVEEFKKKEDENAEAKQVEKDAKKVDQIKAPRKRKKTIAAMAKNEQLTKNHFNSKESKAKPKDKIKLQKKDKAEEKQQINEDRHHFEKKHELDKKREHEAYKPAKAYLKLKEEKLHNLDVKSEQELKDHHRLQEHNLEGQDAEGEVAHVKHEVQASNMDRKLDAEIMLKRDQIRARLHHAIGERMDMVGKEVGWQRPAYEKTR